MKRAWTEHKSPISPGLTFRLSRLAGVFPLEFSDERFTVSKSGLLSSSLIVAAFLLNVFVHVEVSSPRVFSSHITEILNLVQILAYDASVLSAIWFVVWNRQILSEVINTLSQLEYAMFRLGIEVEKAHSYTWSTVTLLVTWLVFSLDCISLESFSLGGVFYIFSHYYLVSLIVLVNAMLSWMAGHIESCFRCLSTALQVSRDLQHLVVWHQRLTASCRLLSRVYSVELLILFATALVSCTSEAYLAYRLMKTQRAIIIVVYVYWTCILYSICFRVIAACVNTKDRALEFDAELYKLIVNDLNGDYSFYSPSYRLYFHYCGKSRVAFNAFSFFQIDWQLATTMVAAGCTYLVILVQFAEN